MVGEVEEVLVRADLGLTWAARIGRPPGRGPLQQGDSRADEVKTVLAAEG